MSTISKYVNLTGQQFGRLTVIGFKEYRRRSDGHNNGYWRCIIDPDGNYCPSNCRWATAKEQGNNKRQTIFFEIDGVRKPLSQWAEDTGIPRQKLYSRWHNGDRGYALIKATA